METNPLYSQDTAWNWGAGSWGWWEGPEKQLQEASPSFQAKGHDLAILSRRLEGLNSFRDRGYRRKCIKNRRMVCTYSHWMVNSKATVCLFSLSLDDSFLWALFPSQQQTLGAGDIGRTPIRKATFKSINYSHMYSFPWTTIPQSTVDSRGWTNPDRDYSKLEGKEFGTDKQW